MERGKFPPLHQPINSAPNIYTSKTNKLVFEYFAASGVNDRHNPLTKRRNKLIKIKTHTHTHTHIKR